MYFVHNSVIRVKPIFIKLNNISQNSSKKNAYKVHTIFDRLIVVWVWNRCTLTLAPSGDLMTPRKAMLFRKLATFVIAYKDCVITLFLKLSSISKEFGDLSQTSGDSPRKVIIHLFKMYYSSLYTNP